MLSQDIAILNSNKPSTYHKMFRFVLIYRIGQKRILHKQIVITLMFLDSFRRCDSGLEASDVFERDMCISALCATSHDMQSYLAVDLD